MDTNTVSRLFIVVLLSGFIGLSTGCGKKEVPPYDAAAGSNMPEGKNIEYGAAGSGRITEEIGPTEETLDSSMGANASDRFSTSPDQSSDEYKRQHGRSSAQLLPVYFDFDRATIRTDQISSLEINAAYMKSSPSSQLVIEGNCDERGTNEYNLALGEHRALSAKKYLVELGVEEYRIRTISYGEERPLFLDHDEFSWSQNRRDDFVVE